MRFLLPLVFVAGPGFAAVDADLPTWPDPATFTPGQENKFRLPGFAPYLAYPDKDPYYNVLMVPANYDPKRSYPLGIEFQPQNGKPSSWFLAHANDNQSFVLGVSWMIPASAKDRKEGDETKGPDDVHIGPILHMATIQWVLEHFNVDRARVFVGGMSAGGWAASSEGMSGFFKNVSTHFVILNAGNRGTYNPAWFAGDFAFVASGTADFNNAAALQAIDELSKAKLDVTHYEEPGIGHDVGPQTYIKLAEWYRRFDPSAHAQEWLDQATAALADKATKDPTAALAQLAEVATLGENSPQGKAAREALLAREGDALTTYERGYDALLHRRYAEAQKLLIAAQKAAAKTRTPRIMTLASKRLAEIQEWMFSEESVALQAAHAAGRDLEAAALAQDCATRWKDEPKDWPANITMWIKVTTALAQAQKPDPKHRQAQLDLVKWRLALMTAKADGAADNKKGHDILSAIVDALPDSGEAAEAKELLTRWPVVEAKK